MKGGVGGPCCHCGATSSPCWRKGPAEKPILCNACGARYLVKRSLDGYMPGQKPSKFATTSPACPAPGDVQQQKPGPKRGVGDGSSRKRRVVDRYDLEDLYTCTFTNNTKRARGRASQPVAPSTVSINVTAGLGGLVQTSISLWKPADTFTTGRASDAAPSVQVFSYPATKAHLQMDSEAVVLARALALLRQPNGSSDSSSSGSSSCHSSSTSRSPSPAADDFPRRRRKQQHPTAGAAS